VATGGEFACNQITWTRLNSGLRVQRVSFLRKTLSHYVLIDSGNVLRPLACTVCQLEQYQITQPLLF
jgi:hypothetical protein